MQYKITEVRDSSIVVEFPDESWAEVPVVNGMDAEDIDEAVEQFAPKAVIVDENIKALVGETRVAQKKVIPEPEVLDEGEEIDGSWDEAAIEESQAVLVEQVVEKVLERLKAV